MARKKILETYFQIASSTDHNGIIQDSGLMIFSIIPDVGEDSSDGEPQLCKEDEVVALACRLDHNSMMFMKNEM